MSNTIEINNLILQITMLRNQLNALEVNTTNDISNMQFNYATVPVTASASASTGVSSGCSPVNAENLLNINFDNTNSSNCVKGTGTATNAQLNALRDKINRKIIQLTETNSIRMSNQLTNLYGYNFTSGKAKITGSSIYGQINKNTNDFDLLNDSMDNSLYRYNNIYFFYLFLFLHVCFLIYFFLVYSLPVLIDPQNANLPKPNYFVIIVFGVTLLFFGYNYYLDIINKLIIYVNNLLKNKIK